MNPQKQKPAISVCGPRQLIVNSQKAAVTTLCTLWVKPPAPSKRSLGQVCFVTDHFKGRLVFIYAL